MVGTAGSVGVRLAAVQPRTRSLPACTWPMADTYELNSRSTLPSGKILNRGPGAAVGHVHELRARGQPQHLAEDVAARAHALRRIVQAAGLAVSELHQLLDGAGR